LISFFKINDPYRLVGVLILLLAIRLPILLSDMPLMIPELKWLLIGEKLESQSSTMYHDLWHYTAPLSVFVYKWLYIIFGKSAWPFYFFSICLVMLQAAIFNNMMLKNKAYNQNTYVPALMYMLCMNLFVDMITLPPVLLSMTFILLAINNLFKRMDNKTKDELFINTGVFLGIATMFFLPAFFYFLVTILSLLVYTGSVLRRMILLMYGYCLILAAACLYFYWHDAFLIFSYEVLESVWDMEPYHYLTQMNWIVLCAVPILIFIFAYFKMKFNGRYINFQVKIQRVMLFFMLSGVGMFVTITDISTFQLIYFVPGAAFFLAHYLLTIRNWLVAEGTFLLIGAAIIFNNLLFYNGWFFVDRFANYDKLFVTESKYEAIAKGKRVLLLGEGISVYQNARLATPYFDWQLSSVHFDQPMYYDHITEMYDHFQSDMPDVIVDEELVMEAVFELLPTVASKYVTVPEYPNVYFLKD